MKRAAALAFALLTAAARAAPGGADLEAAAIQTAQTLGGVLRDCPASFAGIGFPEKRCVGVGDGVEDARLKLNTALADDLYGVWRSRDGQRSVYNWLKTAGGYVYLRLQLDPDRRTQTLIYLDLPPAQSGIGPSGDASAGATLIGSVTLTPAVPVTAAPEPSVPAKASPPVQTQTAPSLPAETPASTTPSTAPATTSAPPPVTPDPAPMPFGRTLKLQNNRLNGPDVLAVQNRLIVLMRPQRAGQGDGWYGPVTTQTVRVFQKANALPVTGVVDRNTWNRLFSEDAGAFSTPVTP